MKTRLKSLLIIAMIIISSCSKEEGTFKNRTHLVKVNNIYCEYNEINTKSITNKTNTISSIPIALDDNYVLTAELEEAKVELSTKSDILDPLKSVKVLTFYKQNSKTENRVQDFDMTNKTFELPSEGGCDVVFLGLGQGVSTNLDINMSKDKAIIASVNSGVNLAYLIKSYGNSVPSTEESLILKPMFAAIHGVKVDGMTSDSWFIESISNLKIISGCQSSTGDITINNSSVSYVKSKVNNDILIKDKMDGGNQYLNLYGDNIIPNGNNFIISTDVKLTDKTNSVNLKFDFKQPLVSGKSYNLKISVKRKGISIKFYTNTQQLGVYSESFNAAQQTELNNLNSSNNGVGTDGTVYFTPYTTVTLPANPQKDSESDYNPNSYMEFVGWSLQQDCKTIITDNEIRLISLDEIKTSDEIKLYAYFRPVYYYWNGTNNACSSGVYGLSYSTLYYMSNLTATSSSFSNTPTAADYKKYFGYGSVFFYDNGYTKDKQQGYWVQKWSISKNNTQRDVVNNNGYEIVAPTGTITNGDFSKTSYNKSDFFFIPILGFYYPINQEVPYALNNNGVGGATDGAYWSKDVTKVNNSGSYAFVSQGINVLEDGKGIKLSGQTGTSSTSGYHVYGFSPIGDQTFTYRNALLSQWPDTTYGN